MSTLLQKAQENGYNVTKDTTLVAPPHVQRLLEPAPNRIAYDMAGGVLEVICDHLPVWNEISAWEKTSGCRVTVTVTTPEILALIIKNSPRENRTDPLLQALNKVTDDVHDIVVTIGSPIKYRSATSIFDVDKDLVVNEEDFVEAVNFLHGKHPEVEKTVTWKDKRWRAKTIINKDISVINLTKISTSGTIALPQNVEEATTKPGLTILGAQNRFDRIKLREKILRLLNNQNSASTALYSPLGFEWSNNQHMFYHLSEFDTHTFNDLVYNGLDHVVIDLLDLKNDQLQTIINAAAMGVNVILITGSGSVMSSIWWLSDQVGASKTAHNLVCVFNLATQNTHLLLDHTLRRLISTEQFNQIEHKIETSK